MLVLDEILADLANMSPLLSCDNADHSWCAKGEVKWRALVRCPFCGQGRTELWCTPCRDLITFTDDGFQCAQCETLVFPARGFVTAFEALS